MSMDIRSYFSKSPKAPAAPKPKKRAVISSDEEDDTRPAKSSEKPSKKISKKAPLSSSEDDSPKKHKKTPSKSKKNEKTTEKTVSVAELFAKTPIKRVNAPKKPDKPKPNIIELDDDEDFAALASQVDTEELDVFQSKEKKSSKRKKLESSDDEKTTVKKAKVAEKADKKANSADKSSEKSRTSPKSPEKSRRSPSPGTSSNNHSEPTKKLKFGNLKNTKSKVEVTESVPKPKKKVTDEEAEFFEERAMKKKNSAALYQAYLSRGGARNPGSKPIPEGSPNCLAGLSFVVTGVFDSLEREEMNELIKKYGGRVTQSVSKKINYLVVGEEGGQSKLTKAQSLGIKEISEDDLLELIGSRPAGNSRDVIQSKSRKKSPEKAESPEKVSPKTSPKDSSEAGESKKSTDSSSKGPNKDPSPKKSPKEQHKGSEIEESTKSSSKSSSKGNSSKKTSGPSGSLGGSKGTLTGSKPATSKFSEPPVKREMPAPGPSFKTSPPEEEALVEKYRPKSMKQIVGQYGDNSNAKKLHNWLQNWHKNRAPGVKLVKPLPWAKNDNGAFFRAALLSGPPGIGKTTTVQVVCKELNFDLLEFNASDTRSKRLLKDEVSSLLSNTTMKGYFLNQERPTANHVLLMDEVDGMAGNEDRGGLQELIALIKSTDVPIVCICNDRNNPKMRTLANYVFDLRFNKPRLEQIRGAMKSICFKENIKITDKELDRLIEATNFDLRQVINHLALLVGDPVSHPTDKPDNGKINKDLKLGPWDVVRKVFSAEDHKTMSIHDKSDLFFHDYNISGLFVQENYLSVNPKAPRSELLDRVARAADSLSLGDQVERAIRSNNAWSLLPTQACFSSVIPGTVMSGNITGQIQFPGWLGRNSKKNKFDRLLQEITVHTRLVTGASKEAINMDYLKALRDAVVGPLVRDGVDGVEGSMDMMNHYHLLREDLDSLVEVSLWPGDRDPMQSVEPKVKAAFTRAYNKSSAPVPFVVNTTVSKKRGGAATSQDEGFIDDEEDAGDDEEEEDESVESDKMIKAKKPTATKDTATASTSKASKAKTTAKRGRGRGK